MNHNDIYSTPKSEITETLSKKPTKASKLLILFSVILVLINGFFALLLVRVPDSMDAIAAQGYTVGQLLAVILFPLIIVGFFQIGKGYRNSSSRVKVFFWTSVVVLLSKLGNVLSLISTV